MLWNRSAKIKYAVYDQGYGRCSANFGALIYTIRVQQALLCSRAGSTGTTQRTSKHPVEFAASMTESATRAIDCAFARCQQHFDNVHTRQITKHTHLHPQGGALSTNVFKSGWEMLLFLVTNSPGHNSVTKTSHSREHVGGSERSCGHAAECHELNDPVLPTPRMLRRRRACRARQPSQALTQCTDEQNGSYM